MLKRNITKEKLKKGEPVFGFRMEFAAPFIVEVLGHAGFDFVYFDCEHGPMSEGEVEEMIRAAELMGMTPMVRVAANQPHHILQSLDSGAMGIIIPHCGNKEEAQAAVHALKYPPEGDRGIAGRSWTHWVMSGNSTADYVKKANQETLLVAMIEDAEGISQVSDILTVDELDCVFIGRADLSVSLGVPGQGNHPMINDAVDKVLKEAASCGKAVGIGFVDFGDPDGVKRFIQKGAQLFSMGSTAVLVKTAKDLLKQIKGS